MPSLTEAELLARGLAPATIADWLQHGLLFRAPDGSFEPTPVALEVMNALAARRGKPRTKTVRAVKPRAPRKAMATAGAS